MNPTYQELADFVRLVKRDVWGDSEGYYSIHKDTVERLQELKERLDGPPITASQGRKSHRGQRVFVGPSGVKGAK